MNAASRPEHSGSLKGKAEVKYQQPCKSSITCLHFQNEIPKRYYLIFRYSGRFKVLGRNGTEDRQVIIQ